MGSEQLLSPHHILEPSQGAAQKGPAHSSRFESTLAGKVAPITPVRGCGGAWVMRMEMSSHGESLQERASKSEGRGQWEQASVMVARLLADDRLMQRGPPPGQACCYQPPIFCMLASPIELRHSAGRQASVMHASPPCP